MFISYKPYFQVLNLSRKPMSTNPNLITLLKIASTINLKVTISTNFIFTQPPWEHSRQDKQLMFL
jgi:hypothetical protein